MKITANKKAIIEQNVEEILRDSDITFDQKWDAANIPIAKIKLVAYIVSLLEAKK